MGWGAWGFSGGMAAGSWVDRLPTPMTPPQQRPLPYFKPQLLRNVPWHIHQQPMNESGYQLCACPDCVRMDASHDLPLAKRHELRPASEETAALTSVPAHNAAGSSRTVSTRPSRSATVSRRPSPHRNEHLDC